MEEEEKKNAAEETQQTETKEQEAAVAAEEGASAPEEKMPRDLFHERIRTNFPDGKYDEDEQEVYRRAGSYMDELESTKKDYEGLMVKFENVLGGDPQKAEVILDILDGVDPRVAYARHYGPEYMNAPEEGSPEYEDFVKAGDERKKELDSMKAQVDEYRANAESSAADLDSMAEENKWTPEEKAEVESFVTGLLEKIYSGRLDKDFYNLIQRGRHYDDDIAGAREQGRVEGRNEKIEVEKKHLAGSGLPNAKSGGNASEEVDAKPAANKTVDWLDRMSKRRV